MCLLYIVEQMMGWVLGGPSGPETRERQREAALWALCVDIVMRWAFVGG